MLYVDESSERDNLLQYEEPSDLTYTGATFANGEDVRLTSYHDDGRRTSGVNEELFNSDSDEEVAFDLSEYKSLNQVDVDVKALLKTRNPTNHES